MNKVIKISRIFIENFKTIEKATLRFNEQTVTVLDGPNGFGKTTIFDAIELSLTGSIRRIKQLKICVGNRGYEDYLFAINQSRPIIIKVELNIYNSEYKKIDSIIVGRKIDPSLLNKIKKRPNEFDFTIHLLDDFDEDLTEGNKISQELFEERIGISDLASKFGLYNYIEQEEATHLLKKNEKERMEAISKLFNIETEVKERDILEQAKKRLITYKTSINQKIKENSRIISTVEFNPDQSEVEYFQLINIPNNKIIWDQKNIKILDKENKIAFLEQLEAIKELIVNFDEFKNELKNESIRKITDNGERLAALIILGNFEKELDLIKEEYKLKKQFEDIKINIESKKNFLLKVNWDLVYEHFNLNISKEELLKKIEYIKSLKIISSNLSNIVEELLSTREKLVSKYEEYFKSKKIDGNECPLCGSEWGTYQDLIKQINKKTEVLKNELDNSTANMLREINNLYENFLNELIIQIEQYIKQAIDEDFFNQLNNYMHLKLDIDKAKKYFSDFDIDISNFFNKEKRFVDNLSEKVEDIKKLLYSKLSKSKLEIEKFFEFKRLYKEIFFNNEELLKSIEIEKINQKKQYIEYMYYIQTNELLNRFQKLNNKLEEIDGYINIIANAIKVYNEKINGYNANVISEIEIPFYIYSGKIIQNHQRGIGVFIKEEDSNEQTEERQLKAINFVPPEKTDHDIIHSFSAGQLSATVIAFSLALNKVYNKSGLRTVLIDDPVQTMDEINMASFVELLRNEFPDRQIILSTHEDKISMYIRYKFSKYGYKTGNINVKEEFYDKLFSSSNKD